MVRWADRVNGLSNDEVGESQGTPDYDARFKKIDDTFLLGEITRVWINSDKGQLRQ